jgi:hypothetical protein
MIKLAVVDGHIFCSVVGSAKEMCPGLGFRGLGIHTQTPISRFIIGTFNLRANCIVSTLSRSDVHFSSMCMPVIAEAKPFYRKHGQCQSHTTIKFTPKSILAYILIS